jgi:nucleolar complex protein 3
LSDDDADLLDHGAALGFLANLPKAAMDKEVSVSRIREKKALKKDQKAREAQQLDLLNGAAGTSKKALKVAARAAAASGKEKKSAPVVKDDDDDLEEEEGEEWERGPRRLVSHNLDTDLTAAPLPIKTLQGEIITHPDRAHAAAPGSISAPIKSLAIAGITIQDDLEDAIREKELEKQRRAAQAAAEVARREEAERRAAAEKARQEREAAGGLGSLRDYDSIEQRREAAKQAMAVAAQALLGEPEVQISKQLRVLLGLLSDEDTQVSRLAMLTLLAVLKDLIPGYRIRSAAERKQEGVEISKEVKKLWDYENSLLKGYQTYLKSLLAVLNAARSGHATAAHGRVAARCLAGLLVAAPHFNYSSDLLQAVVPNMVNKDDQIREHCCGAVALLLRSALGSAEAGQAAVESVQLVADLIKRRKCIAPREVVDALLELSFPEILSGEDFIAARLARKKKKKKDKKKDEVDKGFKEAQAVVDRDTRRHQQSTILEALFEIFFRVLKTATASGLVSSKLPEEEEEEEGLDASYTPPLPASRFAKRFPLLAPTMEGLSKFSHLISIDYFQDLMAALEELLGSPALPPAQRLRCLLTASEILRGQGEALTIDRKTFYNHLYSSLNQVAMTPLIEDDFLFEVSTSGAGGSLDASEVPSTAAEAAAALSQHAAFVSDTSQVPTLLAKLLESMLLDSKLLDATRQAAFAKRAAGTAVAAGDTGVAMGLVCVLQRIMRRQPKLRNMLENEAGGPSGYKAYRPQLSDPAEAGALSVPLWELSVLAKHYHPHISQAARDISVMNVAAAHAAAGRNPGSGGNVGGSAVLPLGTTAVELSAQYSTAKGGFKPPPKVPASWGPQQAQQASQSKAGRARATAQRKAADDPLAVASFLEKLEEAGGTSTENILPTMEADEEADAAHALSRHYSLNRRFQKNRDLRNEHALLAIKLRRFHEHLQKKGKTKGGKTEKKKKRDKDGKVKEKEEKKRKGRK